eukprot:GHVO01027947.1.p1 GENE.GHVO01027947.1~~GHVO01027947.1.p1  ORF type:complete len:543 (+),score=43.71 GHVO01027947.1:505-2133(+)
MKGDLITALDAATNALHGPQHFEVISRQEELRKITESVDRFVAKAQSGAVLVCGSPGTGKTCCIEAVTKSFQQTCRIVQLNALGFGDPLQCLRRIGENFGCTGITSRSPWQIAESIIHARKNAKQSEILVVDEGDQLQSSSASTSRSSSGTSKSQMRSDALAQLFRIGLTSSSRIIVIAIANAVPVAEYLGRVAELLGHPENYVPIVFRPYSVQQLGNIVRHRIKCGTNEDQSLEQFSSNVVKNGGVIDAVALEMCVRKVASVGGDCRQVLEACRRLFMSKKENMNRAEGTRKRNRQNVSEATASSDVIATPKLGKRTMEMGSPNNMVSVKRADDEYMYTSPPKKINLGIGEMDSCCSTAVNSPVTSESDHEESHAPVDMEDVKEMIGMSRLASVKDHLKSLVSQLPLHQQLLLVAACAVVKDGRSNPLPREVHTPRKGKVAAATNIYTVAALQAHYEQLCKSHSIPKTYGSGLCSIWDGLQCLKESGLAEIIAESQCRGSSKGRRSTTGMAGTRFELRASVEDMVYSLSGMRNGGFTSILR